MSKFDYFKRATPGWQNRAAGRLYDLLKEQGDNTQQCLQTRLANEPFGSFSRRRYAYMLTLLTRVRKGKLSDADLLALEGKATPARLDQLLHQ